MCVINLEKSGVDRFVTACLAGILPGKVFLRLFVFRKKIFNLYLKKYNKFCLGELLLLINFNTNFYFVFFKLFNKCESHAQSPDLNPIEMVWAHMKAFNGLYLIIRTNFETS